MFDQPHPNFEPLSNLVLKSASLPKQLYAIYAPAAQATTAAKSPALVTVKRAPTLSALALLAPAAVVPLALVLPEDPFPVAAVAAVAVLELRLALLLELLVVLGVPVEILPALVLEVVVVALEVTVVDVETLL